MDTKGILSIRQLAQSRINFDIDSNIHKSKELEVAFKLSIAFYLIMRFWWSANFGYLIKLNFVKFKAFHFLTWPVLLTPYNKPPKEGN